MRTFLFFHDNDVNLITVNLLSWNLYLREGGLWSRFYSEGNMWPMNEWKFLFLFFLKYNSFFSSGIHNNKTLWQVDNTISLKCDNSQPVHGWWPIMLCDQFFVVFAHCVFTDQAPDLGYGSVGFRLSIKHIVLHKFHVINGSHFIRNTIHDHAESKMIILIYCIPHAFLSIFRVFKFFLVISPSFSIHSLPCVTRE